MSGCTGACHSGGGCTCTRTAPPPLSEQERAQFPREFVLEHDLAVALAEKPAPVFSQGAYSEMTASLDAIMNLMKIEFHKTEAEAQAWLQSFITHHYFPVWRKMTKKE